MFLPSSILFYRFAFFFASVHLSRFCTLSTRALGQNCFVVVRHFQSTVLLFRLFFLFNLFFFVSVQDMASSVSVAYLYARPPFDPSLAFLSHSNCSLICCDRSNCHHLPTGDQQRRTSVFLCVYHCRQFIYNPIEGTPFVLHLFCCCRPLRILFSGHLLLLRFPLSSFPLPSGRPFLHLLPLLACPTVCY